MGKWALLNHQTTNPSHQLEGSWHKDASCNMYRVSMVFHQTTNPNQQLEGSGHKDP